MATVEKYNNVATLSKKKIFLNNFIGGIAWAFGTLVGFAVIAILIGTLFSRVDLVPIVGDFVGNVVEEAVQSNPRLVESQE